MNDARSPIKRPPRLALSNWPVRAKVLAIVLVPLLLACAFGGLRISASATAARDLRVAATRADMVPPVADYMAALEGVLLTATDGGDVPAAVTTFDDRTSALRSRLDGTEVDDAVRLATNTLLDYGKDLADKTVANAIDLRTRVMTYAPLLITAETAITGLVSGDDDTVRSAGDALARAVGARGQMTMQQMLVDRGGDLPEPDLRSSMITLAGTEPSNVSAMGAYLGGSSDPAASLRSEMVKRMSLLSDPGVVLAGNPDLLSSQRITRGIADGVIAETSRTIPATVEDQAAAARTAALRDAVLVGAAIVVALLVVTLVARSLIRPLRTLRTSALKVAHEDPRPAKWNRSAPTARPRRCSPSGCTPPRRSARWPTPSTNCTNRPSCSPANRPGCRCRSPTCSRRCRGATDPWSTSSSRSSTDSRATSRIPTGSTACSAWITSRRGCGATAPT